MSRGNAQIALTLPSLLLISLPLAAGKTYVHKTHDSPAAHPGRPLSCWLTSCYLQKHWFTPLYIYRDPRDVILSAYEYGIRKAEKGHPNFFSARVPSIETGVDWIKLHLKNWQWWMNHPGIIATRYEDFLTDYDHQLAKVFDYLELDVEDKALRSLVEKYRPGKPPQPGTHFHKGIVGRFREVFSAEQIQFCHEELGHALRAMNYPPS